MDEIVITNSLLSVGFALLAVIMSWACLRLLDWMAGIQFRTWLLNANSFELAIYFSARIVAVSILMGMVLS